MDNNTDKIWADIQERVRLFQVEAEKVGLYHRGYRFWPPYACCRCGEPVSAYQFAFSRSCGGCDRSRSHTARLWALDKRWFVLGKAMLENDQDEALIDPEFVPAHERRSFPVLDPVLMPRPTPHHQIARKEKA